MENGEKVPMNIVNWRSQKAPRESLGSSGSEVQAVSVGKDVIYLVRGTWMEIDLIAPVRGKLKGSSKREHPRRAGDGFGRNLRLRGRQETE